MTARFVDQVVRCTEPDYQPVTAPNDPHPTRGNWVNLGVDGYKAVFGAAEYEKESCNDIPFPMPEDTPRIRGQLWWRMNKARVLFGAKALMTGHRGTHMQGVGGRGTITVASRPEFPENDFFIPGKVFPCRLRHANASFYDDASCQVRACSLKFADHDADSPLDIQMNTGVIQAFWSFDTFMQFVFARLQCREDRWDPQREYMRKLPGAFIGAIESVRLAPRSYADMLYHTCIVYPFLGRDGRERYAKYRVVPKDLKQESGLLPPEWQKHPWVQCRAAGDDRPRQYLPDDFRSRVAAGRVEYQLQIQLREFVADRDTWEFFNSARVWDPAVWPWTDLATIRITEALPDPVTERMRFWLGHQPPSLGLTSAYSAVDYRSLAWVRYRVYPFSQRSRAFLRMMGKMRRLKADF